MNDDLREIQIQRENWIGAINQASAAGFVSALTDDAVWLPARHDALQGKDQIQAWLEGPFEAFDFDYSVSEIRLRIAGAWAVEQARFSTRLTTRSGDTMPPHEGRYTLIWRKEATGKWFIERYIDLSAHFDMQ